MKRRPAFGVRRPSRWVGALVVIAACGAEESRRADGSTASDDTADGALVDTANVSGPLVPLRQLIAEGAYAHGLPRRDVIARFGRPDSVRSMPVPNRHDPSVTDSVVQLLYPTARYTYYVVTQGPGEILDEALITSNDHLRHTSPGIGTSEGTLRAAYGAPASERPGELVYECRTCEVPEPLTFVLVDGTVTEIRFDYYVD